MDGITYIESAGKVEPYWQRLPKFFRYPLHVEPLLYMALLSLASLAGFIVPLPGEIGFLIVLLGVWLAFFRYAYKVLDQTAQGLLTPDRHRLEADPERTNLPYKQFGIFVVMGTGLGIAQALNSLLFGIVLVFTVLAIPASVMILALTRSFWAGLNPLALFGMMRSIGLPYLGMCALLFMLSANQELLTMMLAPRVSPWLLLPLLNFVAMFFTLIMFNMMGYVVHQYHAALGVPQQAGIAAEGKAPQESGADIIGRLVGAGQIDEALEIAYEAQRVAPEDIGAVERYFKLLKLAGKQDRLVAQGRRYLTLLLKKGRSDDALALHAELLQLDARFEPEQPQQLLSLAEAARRRRDLPRALNLIKGYDKRFPRNPAIPSVYLFAAQILCEHYKQEGQARQILSTLMERYPEHPAGIEARQYVDVLDRMAAGTAS